MQLVFLDVFGVQLTGSGFTNMSAFGRILWANQACKKCAQKIRNSKLEGVKKLNLEVKIELNMFLNVKF